MLRFLCGCSSNLLDTPIENRSSVLDTLSAISLDDEGLLICAIHRKRRYGWRPPCPHGAKGIHHTTAFEYENKEIFGIEINAPIPHNTLRVSSYVPDLRPIVPTAEEVKSAVEDARRNIAARSAV